MKILVVDTEISGELIGGTQLFLPGLLTGLVNRGHEVHLVAKGTPNPKVRRRIEATGAKLHPKLWDPMSLVVDASPGFAKWLNDLRPEVFLISTSADLGWVVLPLINSSTATLTIGHNDENTYYTPVKHYSKFLTRAIGVSDEICRKYVNECGLPTERVEWIPYGVETSDDQPVTPEAGPVRLIYVGRFENTQKRISDVVKIIQKLDEAGIDFTFDMVGDGEEMPAVRSALVDQIEAGHVRLHGWVESAKVMETMRSSEVFILASAYEGFCISLTEAMANGCCPVVSDIDSGNKQLVHQGVNGFIVPVGEVDGFVDRIRVLAEDRDRLREMRVAAWRMGRDYGVDRMVDNYVACFERAIEHQRSDPRA